MLRVRVYLKTRFNFEGELTVNRFESEFPASGEARLRYGDGDFQIAEQGDFVRCAVTEQHVPIKDLKYWSVRLQEPYVSASAALQRLLEAS